MLVIWFQAEHDRRGPPFTTRIKLAKRNLLPEKIIPFMSFGFSNVIADVYWIRAIQDFIAWNGKEGFYIGYFKNITTADPRFEYPYLFALLTIPQSAKIAKDPQQLIEITPLAEKGMNAIPTSWQIPFFLGTQYYIFTKEYEPTESYLKIAASKPGSPQGASLLYATFVSKTVGDKSKPVTSQDMLKVIRDNTDNDTLKKIANQGVDIRSLGQAIVRGILAYKTQYKRYPKTVDELIELHFVSLPADFLDIFTVTINEKTGSFRIKEK